MTQIALNRIPTADDRMHPALDGMEALLARIRQRAKEIASGRGGSLGRELDDWLQAERELCDADAELFERDDAYECDIALAGYEPSEVSVTVTPRELLVEAAHKTSTAGRNAATQGRVRWSELHASETTRRVEFDQDIIVDKTTASLRNGLLKVVLPKSSQPDRKVDSSAAP